MQAYLINLDTVNAKSTIDTINFTGNYVGGSIPIKDTSGENLLGGYTGGNYYNSAKSSSSSTAGGGGTAG